MIKGFRKQSKMLRRINEIVFDLQSKIKNIEEDSSSSELFSEQKDFLKKEIERRIASIQEDLIDTQIFKETIQKMFMKQLKS